MSCICQYYAPALDKSLKLLPIAAAEDAQAEAVEDDAEATEDVVDITKAPESDDTKNAVCASDLVQCRAQNWLLTKKLHEHEITIESLEQLVNTLMAKQHQILSEMFEMRKENNELRTQCRQQREYHLLERNALIMEAHNSKTLLINRTKALESTSARNEMLSSSLNLANKKIKMWSLGYKSADSMYSEQSGSSYTKSSQEENEQQFEVEDDGSEDEEQDNDEDDYEAEEDSYDEDDQESDDYDSNDEEESGSSPASSAASSCSSSPDATDTEDEDEGKKSGYSSDTESITD